MKFEATYGGRIQTAREHALDDVEQRLYRDRTQLHSHPGVLLAPLLNRLVEKDVPFRLTYSRKYWQLELDT